MTGWRRLVGSALVVASMCGALSAGPRRLEQLRATEATGRLTTVDGVTSLAGVAPVATAFLAYVRRVLPAGDRVELVVPGPEGTSPDPPRTVCGRRVSNGRYYWYLYLLLPRPVTCGRPDVVLYVGVTPAQSGVSLPARAQVHDFAPGYLIAFVAAGSR